MTLRPILIHPDKRLKRRAAPVGEVTDALRTLADDMLATMYDAPGVGLAAPQVGVNQRLLVMDPVRDEEVPAAPRVLFDPEITWASEETSVYEEGCLSIPEHFADVERPAEVEVRWLDRDGRLREDCFTGFPATIVQHEIDHLDGKLFIDHLSPVRRQMITRKMAKAKREQARA